MADAQQIHTQSFVQSGGKLVNTQQLTPQQRRRLAVWLKLTYLNTLFQGRAHFLEGDGEGEPDPRPL